MVAMNETPVTLKLGKKPARKGAVLFKLANYINKAALPVPPLHFGHEKAIKANAWAMLGNDQVGDCVLAGAAHETMLWNLEAGTKVAFNDKAVLSDYTAVTGYDPADPNTDQGTDMQAAASYRRKTGVVDSKGKRHKIEAYLAITPGDLQEHLIALYLFGAVGIGLQFPAGAMTQFNAGKPWSTKDAGGIDGGHYVPLVAKREYLEVVTWGKIQRMTHAFFAKYNDESVAYVSLEALTNNKSPEGFDSAALLADLEALK